MRTLVCPWLLLTLTALAGCEREPARPASPRLRTSATPAASQRPRAPSLARGRRAYRRRCAACHGLDGRGDGPNAAYLPRKPPALEQPATLARRLLRPRARMHVEPEPEVAADIAHYLAAGVRAHPGLRLSGADRPDCDTCHHTPGPRIVEEANCAGCHRIPGLRRQAVGPDLAGVGSRFQAAFLTRYLRAPYNRRQMGYRPLRMTRMPDFHLSPQEAADLTTALLALRTPLPAPPPADPALATTGKRLVEQMGCLDCHRIGKAGGRFGPDLTGVGRRLRWPYLLAWLRDPRALSPDTPMPRPGLAGRDLLAVASYLATLRAPSMDDHQRRPSSAARARPGRAKVGRALLIRLRCAACHAIPGIPPPRPEVPLSLAALRSDPDWLYTYLDQPARRTGPGRMPRFRFTGPERMALVDALTRAGER